MSEVEAARNSLFNFPELFDVKGCELLFQLHWQNRDDFRETEFVGQVGGTAFEEIHSRLTDLVERRKGECPEGWIPMVCNQESEHFVRAAAKSADAT